MHQSSPKIHNAIYRAERSRYYCNNPLVEAMPEFLSEEEFRKCIQNDRSVPDDLFSLPSIDALDEIDRLKGVFYPLPLTYQLYEHVYTQLRRGYEFRNPMLAEHRRIMNQLSQELKQSSESESEGDSEEQTICPTILVSGEAGAGKSGSIRRTLRLFRQVIKHSSYHGQILNSLQVTWLSFDMHASESKKDFAYNFFMALDKATGLNTGKEFLKSGSTVEQTRNAIPLAVLKYNIGIIHIDEVQFALNRKKSDKNTPSFPELESFFNKLGIPLILSTTQDALNRFEKLPQESENQQSAGQTSRRLASVAHIKFRQWTLSDRYTHLFFDSYFPESFFKENAVKNREFLTALMILCAGVPDALSQLSIAFLRNWYKQSRKGSEADWMKLLNKVYESKMSIWHAPLSKLRREYKVGNWPASEWENESAVANLEETNDVNWEEVNNKHQSFRRKPRTTKHQHKAANSVERIDEGKEVIDAESIIMSFGQGECDV
ncbi:AAA family ATPase [Alteromonas confluentis]|uniref:ORC1/DEAH AAA+ ATPase domain-containing protein n=1 Tax=Alteromonas confluentis TaxID=1656094 RepID=A0A1E7ZBB0_9ALTE|nr:AAA family ATPase [Alteromonas confluentis]OFC70813.1 hypothetical protein BFC18_11410 [Alteromonas confluentis]